MPKPPVFPLPEEHFSGLGNIVASSSSSLRTLLNDVVAFVEEAQGNVKVSANDTLASFLRSKLVAGPNVTIDEQNDGGNETLLISATGGGGGGSLTVIDRVAWAAPSTTKAEVLGVDLGGAPADFAGTILADGNPEQPLIDIVIPTPTGPDLTLFDDLFGVHRITVQDDGTTAPPTPAFTTGAPGRGLLVELDQFNPGWDLDALIAALNAWGLANLSTTPATIATLSTAGGGPFPPPTGGETLDMYGQLEVVLSSALVPVLSVEYTSPPTELQMYLFNFFSNDATDPADLGLSTPAFGIGVSANGPARPGGATVEVHKYVAGGPKINGEFAGLHGMLCLCGPGSTMAQLKAAIEAVATVAVVTIITGDPGDLCSDVFTSDGNLSTNAGAQEGPHHAKFDDFFSNGGSRFSRHVIPDALEAGSITVHPPTTNFRNG